MKQWKVVILLSYISIASITSAIITPALTHIETFYNLSHGALEWVISIFLLGYVFGQLLYGPIANRFGRLMALRLGLLIALLGIVLCIISTYIVNYNLLLLGRLISALGSAAGLSCTLMLINELLSVDKAKQAVSFALVSFTAGIGIAVTLGGIITTYIHWQYTFYLLFIYTFLMFLSTYLFPETLKEPIKINLSNVISRYSHALSNSNLVIFSISLGYVAVISYCYSAAAPIYAISELNLTASSYGYWNLVTMFGMLLSGILSASLMKAYTPIRVLSIGFITVIPCLISLFLIIITKANNPLWFFLTTMAFNLFGGIFYPACSYLASNSIEDKASASSMMSFLNMLTATTSVIIMGYLPFTSIVSFALVLFGVYLIILILCMGKVLKKKSW